MSGVYRSDRVDLIVEALVDMGKASQTQIETWLYRNPQTKELLGGFHSTRKSINSWTGVYLNRLREKGIVKEAGLAVDIQKGHKPGKLWKLSENICPYCGRNPPVRKSALERL